MRKKALIVLIVSLAMQFFCGSATAKDVRDFKSDSFSTEGKAIYDILVAMVECREKADVDGYMFFYHKDAEITAGGRERILISKKAFYSSIKKKFASRSKNPDLLAKPKIRVKGNKAKVELMYRQPRHPVGHIWMTLSMIKENGRWLITKRSY